MKLLEYRTLYIHCYNMKKRVVLNFIAISFITSAVLS